MNHIKTSRFILIFILLSLVSLAADIAYEGGRSISGQFLEYLKAPALAAGFLALGEFLGYALRLPISFFISIKKNNSKMLWSIIILGYVLVIAIPFLAFVSDWRIALAFYLVERIGKGLRSPARDVVIADITDNVIGRGKGFGAHELLDQVGGFLGPLMISYAITYKKEYFYAYILLLPATLISISLILISFILYSNINVENNYIKSPLVINNIKLKNYMIFVAFLSFGLIHWGIISYHLKSTATIFEGYIPALYAIAMIVDALVAVPLGAAYDKYGMMVLILVPLVSIPIAPIILISNNFIALIIASALYGIVLCSYDSILRAAVADIASSTSDRAIGFGWLGFTWGVSWALGNIVGGMLYDLLGPQPLSLLYPISSALSIIYFIKMYYTKSQR